MLGAFTVLSELDNIVISESEVLKHLKDLDASKTMSPDNINPEYCFSGAKKQNTKSIYNQNETK